MKLKTLEPMTEIFHFKLYLNAKVLFQNTYPEHHNSETLRALN